MKTIKLGDMTKNLDRKRIPLNSAQRLEKSKNKLYPYIGANNIVGYIDEYIFNEEILCIAEDGGSWGANEICANIYNEKCWVNNHAHVLIANDDAHLNYLRHYLNYANLNSYITGATRGKLTRRYLDLIKILVPDSLDDQIRIATLLSRIEALIATRKENLRLLDEFLKSTFFEMFGDPIRNDKGWNLVPCTKVVTKIVSGTSYGGVARSFLESDELGVLKISAVTKGVLDPTEIKAVKKTVIKKKIIPLSKGDFLFSRANTVELVAACCIVDKDYPELFIPDKLWKLSLNEELVNPQYFNYLLKNESFRNKIRQLASGGHKSMLNISMNKFRTLKIPIPAKNQNIFAKVVGKVELIKTLYQQNLTELENLYGALSQKAFKGELDLSRIPLPKNESIEQKIDLPKQTAPSKTKKYNKPTISYLIKTDQKDEKLLCYLFNHYLQRYKNKPFTLEDFWHLADHEKEKGKRLDLEDYELTKKWLYQLIKNGSIQQQFDTEKNKLVLKLKE